MKYGWDYYFEPSPKNVGRWILGIKGILVTASTSAFVGHSPELGFYLLLGTLVLGEFANMIGAGIPVPEKKEVNEEVK